MRTLLEDRQLGPVDPAGQYGHVFWPSLVVPTTGHQRRYADFAQRSGDIPVPEAASHRPELARTPHRAVDIGAHPRERSLHAIRPWVEAAKVAPIELQDRCLVLRAVEVPTGLVPVQHIT